jgi:type II secretory pathway pseudopilin PulG
VTRKNQKIGRERAAVRVRGGALAGAGGPDSGSRAARRLGAAAAAFSLVELLVVIGIIGLLLAILLPAIAEVRRTARQAVSLSNLRALGVGFAEYTELFSGAYPFMSAGQAVAFGCGGTISTSDYWHVSWYWPGLLYGIIPPSESGGVYLSPTATRPFGSCGWPSSYLYSLSFVARPELWMSGAVADEGLLAATYVHEVRQPSRKVLLWDAELPYLGRERRYRGEDVADASPMAFADGHAEVRAPADATDPMLNPFFPESPPHRLHDTAEGVYGRDY